MIKLLQGDCLELMKDIPDHSIDMILCDPPYNTTPCHWDKMLSFKLLWEQYTRIIKNNGNILLFGQEPFSSYVRLSNMDWYKYDWYWEKERLTNVFQVKRRPGKTVENIMVFHNGGVYYPIKVPHTGKLVTNRIGKNGSWSITQAGKNPKTKPLPYRDDRSRHPTQVLRIYRENNHKTVYPTQKPVPLLEYLIKTYTLEGETVLDNTMGSGSTGVACINTNRNFIGMELDKIAFELADYRINSKGIK